PRRLETTFGPVRLPRRRARCRACGRHFQPDDVALGPAVGSGQGTPALRELAALCGAAWPYRAAARVLGRLRGSPVSPETVRQAVSRSGAAVAAQHAAEAAAACRPPAGAPDTTRPRPARLVVELDGAWVRSRDNAAGMEAKVGVVHTGSERVGRTRARLRERRYAATLGGAGAFGPLVTAAVEHVNGFEAAEQTLLGDGAEWIWALGRAVLAEATPVLDRWHLADARGRALRQAVPDRPARAAWTARVEACLEAGDTAGGLAALADLGRAAPHPALDEFGAYLAGQAPRIPDYAARRAAGLPVGSGGVEKGVDVVVNRRLKGKRGMRWWRAEAEAVLALRVAELNGEWDRRRPPALALAP
ncbi:MAG: ISKra4 family transposase, partial [Actinobacteria bacterium]|nr:ISKra4 family transposase [Actinomycetota bacterium]